MIHADKKGKVGYLQCSDVQASTKIAAVHERMMSPRRASSKKVSIEGNRWPLTQSLVLVDLFRSVLYKANCRSASNR